MSLFMQVMKSLFLCANARFKLRSRPITHRMETSQLLSTPHEKLLLLSAFESPLGAAQKNLCLVICEKAESGYRICVNGTEVEAPIEKGFAVIDRTWKTGDVVKLELKMPSRHVVADERVKEDAKCHAVTQGPLVYCEETVNEETYAIPYYTWANKGDNSKMRVWIPDTTAEEE